MKLPTSAERAALLEATRNLKMARSAHAYVRGNTVKFYQWLAESPISARLPAGPPIWICGDCHLGNLGPVANGAGEVEVLIRDLDQAVIGNPAHDLIRLGLSLATAARGSNLPGVTTARMMEQMVEGYEQALADPGSDDAAPEPAAIKTVKRRALGRKWRHLARERIGDVEPEIPLGKKFWPLDPRERDALGKMLADRALVAHILALEDEEEEVKVVDAAYWNKGCSSLGMLRFAVLLAVRGRKKHERHVLVDVKEAGPPAAPSAPGAKMPSDPAERVVAGARALSPHLGDRMAAAHVLGRPVFIRELAPQDLKLEVEQFTRPEAEKAARYLANVVGKAHARQMDDKARSRWQRALLARHSSAIEAPLWLWESVVDLSGSHEMGYLEHCHRYALAHAHAD